MKKIIRVGICTFLMFMVSSCSRHNHKGNSYSEFVESFNKVEVDEIYKLQENEASFFLYTGRESCQYCGEFVHALVDVMEDMEVQIYYLDSMTEYENSSDELKRFRDLYNIEYVPSLIYFEEKRALTNFDNTKKYSKDNLKKFVIESIDRGER